MYIYIYVCVCVCVYVYMYTHVNIHIYRLKRGVRLSPRRRTRMLFGFMSRCSVPTLCMCSSAHATCRPIIW